MRQVDCLSHQVLCSISRAIHLQCPRISCDHTMRRHPLGPPGVCGHALFPQPAGWLHHLSHSRQKSPKPGYSWQKLHQLSNCLRAFHGQKAAQTFRVMAHLVPRIRSPATLDRSVENRTLVRRCKQADIFQPAQESR